MPIKEAFYKGNRLVSGGLLSPKLSYGMLWFFSLSMVCTRCWTKGRVIGEAMALMWRLCNDLSHPGVNNDDVCTMNMIGYQVHADFSRCYIYLPDPPENQWISTNVVQENAFQNIFCQMSVIYSGLSLLILMMIMSYPLSMSNDYDATKHRCCIIYHNGWQFRNLGPQIYIYMYVDEHFSLTHWCNISDVVGNISEPDPPKIWSPWSTRNTRGIRCHLFWIAGTSNWTKSGRYGPVTVDTLLGLETGGH